jgi:hypothetical protein
MAGQGPLWERTWERDAWDPQGRVAKIGRQEALATALTCALLNERDVRDFDEVPLANC